MSRDAFGANVDSPALSGATGGISGKVTSAVTDAALEGIEVCAYSTELPLPEECVSTGPGGEYTIPGLEPGSYLVEFGPSFESPLVDSQLDYRRQFYDDKSLESEADPVHVSDGLVSGIDAALEPGGEIAGTVTNSKGEQLQKVLVCALEAVERFPERCALTDAQGEYTIVGVAPGEHDVEFIAEGEQNYATQYYNGKESLSQANAVTVTAEIITTGIDAVLVAGGQISGTVTSASSHAGLPEVLVCALPASSGTNGRCTITGPAGVYDLTSLSGGDYKVEFFSGDEYATQYYDEASSLAAATEVLVTAGSSRFGINASLNPAAPRNLLAPSISGNPVAGQTLQLLHGSWTNAPTSYEDQWGRCANSQLGSCHTVARGDSYTLSAADVGSEIRVAESASNVGGTGEFAFSAPTAAVTEPTGSFVGPQVDAVPPPPANHLVPPPAAGVLGTTAAGPSAAQSRALLVRLLGPSGGNARIGALLKRGAYPLSFDALSAGRVQISWYEVPKGAHLSAAKPLLLATGRVSVKRPGIAKLSIKLTASGRSLLAHAGRLKVTAEGVLTPSGHGAIKVTRSFTLKR